jgi:hypothetical protein
VALSLPPAEAVDDAMEEDEDEDPLEEEVMGAPPVPPAPPVSAPVLVPVDDPVGGVDPHPIPWATRPRSTTVSRNDRVMSLLSARCSTGDEMSRA